ncbi:hemolysin family protein [Galactobacter sp.]|uniref:hemolysin family protein n=1 Tax=Galactobacter sp. TaxID=2676125 RepID=UPI0025BB579C|nr:hemolysin family protein [Galactobacter sp.]
MISVWLVVIAVLLSAAAGLLTAAEAAYLALPRSQAEELIEDGKRRRLVAILKAPERHTRAVRFWRIFFQSAGGAAFALAWTSWVHSIWLAGLLATITITLVGFAVVGVSPRRLGRTHAAGVVAGTAPLVRVLTWILGPVPGWLEGIVAPSSGAGDATFFTADQFKDLVDRASASNAIEDAEADLIHSVVELGDTRVRAVMVPRTDMIAADKDLSAAKALNLSLRSGFSRIPVIGEDTDDVRGVVYLKDLVRYVVVEGRPDIPCHAVARRARFVPESKSAGDLLQELQRESVHVAVVIDEYGGTAGLVTLEDLLEEIVGEIDDEYDPDRDEVVPDGDDAYIVPADMDIDDMGDLFDLELEDEDVDTVAGLLAKALGRVPIVGASAVLPPLHLSALTRSGRRNRIGKVRVRRATPAEIDETTPESNRRHEEN